MIKATVRSMARIATPLKVIQRKAIRRGVLAETIKQRVVARADPVQGTENGSFSLSAEL
jgi:hypothetical protein